MTERYLTTAEVADRLHLSTKTLRKRIADGVFRQGEHFFRPAGMQPKWKWSAVVATVEAAAAECAAAEAVVPLAQSGRSRSA